MDEPCQPGFIPRLLGCVGDEDDAGCDDAGLGCALLSFMVSVGVAILVVGVIYCFVFRPEVEIRPNKWIKRE